MQASSTVRSVSVDYSDDELDAIADAFARPDLARRMAPGADHDQVRRAVLQSALRGLVARRAIKLGGTRSRPRITFLEPHATLLGAFVSADAAVTVRHERPRLLRAVSYFTRRDVVVEQHGLPDLAVQRMVAHPRAAAGRLLQADLDIAPRKAGKRATPMSATRRQLTLAIEAVGNREPVSDALPELLREVLFARVGSSSVTLTSGVGDDGTREVSRWAWIDAGDLGLWLVRGAADDPIIELSPVSGTALRDEIEAAWTQAIS